MAQHTVIRYDFRGWGKSDLPQQHFSQVDDLYHLLQILHVEKAARLGSLVGEGVAIDFAIEHPDMVDPLIVATPLVYGFHYSPPTYAHAQAWQALAQTGKRSRLINMDMQDITLGRRLGENARRIIIPNSGSLMNMEKPEEFHRAVLEWLSKHKGRKEKFITM